MLLHTAPFACRTERISAGLSIQAIHSSRTITVEHMARGIGDEIDFLYAGDSAFFIRSRPLSYMPDRMIVRLPGIVDDPQIGFDDRPVLLQIVVRLIVQTVARVWRK